MTRRVRAAALLAALAAAAPAPAHGLTWEEAAAAGLRVGAVRVVTDDVFDLSRPDERHVVGRLANAVHVTTDAGLVRGALLFGPGEPVSAALVRESERRLRALPWIIDAAIEPVAAGPGAVDALVRTHDGWSLSLSLKFNHAGGDDLWRVWVEEQNLLGWGKTVRLSREHDLERETTELAYEDPFLLGSPWRLEAAWQDLSDGRGRRLLLELPFVRLDSPWSAGFLAGGRDLVETQYDDASEVYSFPATLREGRLFAQRRLGFAGRTAWRAGLEYRVHDADYGALAVLREDDLPAPRLEARRVRPLLATAAVRQDRFRPYRHLQAAGSVEDVNLGVEAAAAAGWSGRLTGGDAAFVAEVSAQGARQLGEGFLVVARGSADGRLAGGAVENGLATARVTAYGLNLPRQTLAFDAEVVLGTRLDPERLLYLGGFEGLRGYPNHFRAGERRWIVQAEDRVVTPWRLWGIAQVGFVVYLDAGSAGAPAGGWTRTYADVGAGLRIGNLKGTTSRVITLTVAAPLVREEGVDGWLVVAGNTIRF